MVCLWEKFHHHLRSAVKIQRIFTPFHMAKIKIISASTQESRILHNNEFNNCKAKNQNFDEVRDEEPVSCRTLPSTKK